jgi:Fe2+ transport system protein FeoA
MLTGENAQRQTMPLSLVAPGESVELVDMRLDSALHRRLSDMGLTPGAVIRVVKADPTGAMILAVRHDTRLAVGRSAAHRITVCLTRER